MDRQVIIYSTPTCIYCRMAKDWFMSNNIQYTEYDLSVDAVKRDEFIKKTGQMAVPVIEIDGEIIIGFDKAKIAQILGL